MRFNGDWGGRWTYDVKAPLGDPGGFATVYLGSAEDGSVVAVKVIPAVLPGGQQLHPKLQAREAEIAEKLRGNPAGHLIRILDVARHRGNVLIVMELADKSLGSLAGEARNVPEVVAILKDVGAGLYELHQAGIIHRDLKPGNILRSDGKWKLADFGIARDDDIGTADPTFLGWGTYAYMAPELWEGRSPSIKTDLYALGCIAFELIVGHQPFTGPDVEAFRHQHMQLAAPELPDAVNPTLRSLVGRLLSKESSDRPSDASAVVERLERVIGPGTVIQEQLARLSAEHATERAHEAARIAAERAEDQRRAELLRQALSDLRETCEDGATQLHQTIEGVTIQAKELTYRFANEDAQLEVAVWDGYSSPVPTDSLIVAGEIRGKNRRLRDAYRLANIVYEDESGTLRWRLYQFSASGLVSHYELGPRDHTHGLPRASFEDLDERGYMIGRLMHVWHLADSRFGPWSIPHLFAEAMALPGLPTGR